MSAARNVLVFPCGSEVALEIRDACRFSAHFHLIGASSADDHGRFAFDDYVGGLPWLGDPALLSGLKRVVANRDVAAIYPAMDAAVPVLKEAEGELGCAVVGPSPATARMCLSKRATYVALSGAVRVPEVYASPGSARYPAFCKPDVGYGARGCVEAADEGDAARWLSGHPGGLVCELLPGEEYTVDCFTDRHGRLLYCGPRTRGRVRTGISVRTESVPDGGEFRAMCEAVGDALGMRGGWFLQAKRDASGELCLLEVAARPAGSSALSRLRGANLPLLSLFDAMGEDVEVAPAAHHVTVDRALGLRADPGLSFSRAYIDYDDCLVRGGVVDPDVTAFAYRCVACGVELVLLTRHEGDLSADMEAARVSGLFDRVVRVAPGEPKSRHVDPDDAVFVDDSFAERREVAAATGVPTFAPDAVPYLLKGGL